MMMLRMMLRWDDVDVKNDIEMRCWEWYCDEMMLMLRMTLRWDNVDVDNDIEMRCWWCWKCHCDDVCCVCTWGV